MTNKERYHAVMNFERPDRPIRFEAIGAWKETLKRWRGEGLPKSVNELTFFPHFNMDIFYPVPIGSFDNPNFFPMFDEKVIEEKGDYVIKQDKAGNTIQEFKDGSSSIPHYISFPVNDMADLEKIAAERLDPKAPGRINPNWKSLLLWTGKSGQAVAVTYCGLFGAARHLLGFENLMYAYADNPEIVHRIGAIWEKLCVDTIEELAGLGEIDFVMFWEDMAYRGGSIISENTFREFMTPYYKRVVAKMKDLGINHFWVDSDGDIWKLIPLFMEIGIDLLFPFEVQAGMDILKVKEKYPKNLVIMGGIDKRVLAKDKSAIEAEVMSKVPPLLEKGGYIIGLDHAVPPDVPLENFKYFLELVRSLK